MHTFYLIRHGKKMPTSGEPELSALGHDQARRTAELLHTLPIQRVISSPSVRTQQTARYIGEALGLDVETHPLLRERANWGDDPTQSFEDFMKMWSRSSRERDITPEVGDSSRAGGQRIEQVVEQLAYSDEHSHIVLVTHGGVIADFLRNIFGDEQLSSLLKQFEHGSDYLIRECSITEIFIEDKLPKLRQLASITHLL